MSIAINHNATAEGPFQCGPLHFVQGNAADIPALAKLLNDLMPAAYYNTMLRFIPAITTAFARGENFFDTDEADHLLEAFQEALNEYSPVYVRFHLGKTGNGSWAYGFWPQTELIRDDVLVAGSGVKWARFTTDIPKDYRGLVFVGGRQMFEITDDKFELVWELKKRFDEVLLPYNRQDTGLYYSGY